ncbi:MAG TPA: YbaY family lipoprotein, partial [Anaerolineae bacterium]|nr:YbaY family lipoprotein [Anaerolineae bacterium]
LSTVQTLTTALTSTVLTVAGSGTGITINAAAIVSPDLAASNGLVHEIANVLLPTQVSAAAPSPTGTALITGTISYLPRIALDPKAVIDVQLQDVSLADAPARTIASQSIDAQGRQVPITFTLPYDPAVINAKNRYALAVRISVNGQLRFVNTTAIPVLTNGARSTNLEVLVDPVTSVAGAEGVTPTLAVLTGTVTYPASARLPAAAVLDVQLHDVTTSPALVIAAQSAAVTGRSAPLSYTLKYDPTLIDPKHTYAINARLLVDGRPLYINPISATVQTQGKPATGLALPVEAVSGAPLADDLVTITGTLDIDAATLNPAAVIEVQLQDVSRTDAPAQVVSVQVITAARQSTAIPFTLYYNPYAIDPAHHYQLTARVTISAEVQYESTDQYPVLTAGQLSGVAMKAEALAIAALPPATTATPTAPTPTPTPAPVAGSGVLTGTINGAQPITLTANAEIVVKLLDVSRLDAPSQVVAEQTISVSGQQLPIPFTLNYDAAQIDSTHYYMLLATISVNGELGWLNPQAVWALTYGNAPGNITVMVQPVP